MVAPGPQAFGQAHDQLVTRLAQGYGNQWLATAAHRPVVVAHEGQQLALVVAEPLAALRMQVAIHHDRPAVFLASQLRQPSVQHLRALTQGSAGFGGIVFENGASVLGEVRGAVVDLFADVVRGPDHRQAEAGNQNDQTPEYRVATRHQLSCLLSR